MDKAGGIPLLLASAVYRVVNSTALDLQAGVQAPGSPGVGELSRRQTDNCFLITDTKLMP